MRVDGDAIILFSDSLDLSVQLYHQNEQLLEENLTRQELQLDCPLGDLVV